ncbi:hypothetical protein SO802_024701 [Lithocarpus litseifolius]|uniref:Uncharacterized protein n=1 Tax=Lithocarpus litseifolius TaxID=425828 RepID=A0AAW2CBY5_9ROSI
MLYDENSIVSRLVLWSTVYHIWFQRNASIHQGRRPSEEAMGSMGRFARLVDTPEGMATFRAKCRILDNIEIQHCELGEWLVINRPPGSIVIPMIAFIEGGMEILMDKFHTTPTKSLVNFADLNRILKSEIFLHRDGQLRAVHMILEFKPISNHFQNPKHVIKAKDPSASEEASNIPEAMVQEVKTPDLLALLTTHVGGNAPTILVVPRPPTPTPIHASSDDAPEKKRKRGNASESAEDREITRPMQQPPTKESRVTKA